MKKPNKRTSSDALEQPERGRKGVRLNLWPFELVKSANRRKSPMLAAPRRGAVLAHWARKHGLDYRMKSTVKRWCKECGYTWYGPGVYSSVRYDYKIQFAKGVVALFRTTHGRCLAPREYVTNKGKPFLVFPVFTQFVGEKEMSKAKFTQATDWIVSCLAGKITEYPHAAAQQLDPAEVAARRH